MEEQAELSNIVINGEPLKKLPEDLYIPPDALEVFLENFEGPLDLLLYLIKKQNIDILNIPIAQITKQYMKYIELMKELHIELAAEYLVMAAMLAEIKSRMLLPKTRNDETDEDDPRAELIKKLQEYEQYKLAAEKLDELPRQGRDTFPAILDTSEMGIQKPTPALDLNKLISAFNQILKKESLVSKYHVVRDNISVRECMSHILEKLQPKEFVSFNSCFDLSKGRIGVISTFIAILELFRSNAIEVVQSEPFSPIYIKKIAYES